MSYLDTHLGNDDVLTLLNRATGFHSPEAQVETPPQGVNNQTYLVREAGMVVKVRPGGDGPTLTPSPHWPAYTCALFGPVPNGGVRSLVALTKILQRTGGLPVPTILHQGEGAGPGGSDYTIGEILPGKPFDWDVNPMGRTASRQLGEHLGQLHDATAQTEGFGIFGGDRAPRSRWWPRFGASYALLADEVCRESSALRPFRPHLDVPLRRANHSPDPLDFSLVCVDQNPTHYLGDDHGRITGFVDIEGHLWAPAEWELAVVSMWIPHTQAFRRGYGLHRAWPEAMEDVSEAYIVYTFLEWILCVRTMMDRPQEVADLERCLLQRLL